MSQAAEKSIEKTAGKRELAKSKNEVLESTENRIAQLVDDCCPHCRAGMVDEPVQFEDAIDGLLDELLQGGGIGSYDLATIDRRQLLAAVQAELTRQARARWREQWGLPEDPMSKEYRARERELIETGAWPF